MKTAHIALCGGKSTNQRCMCIIIKMVDRVSEEKRSYIMSRVGSKNTKPELDVRRTLHGLGYRYGLHERKLPGSPDIVFSKKQKAIFVHGCFWHGHNCKYGRLPTSKQEYWGPKIARNCERDIHNIKQLKEAGWDAFVIWQCQLKDRASIFSIVIEFLGPPKVNKKAEKNEKSTDCS